MKHLFVAGLVATSLLIAPYAVPAHAASKQIAICLNAKGKLVARRTKCRSLNEGEVTKIFTKAAGSALTTRAAAADQFQEAAMSNTTLKVLDANDLLVGHPVGMSNHGSQARFIVYNPAIDALMDAIMTGDPDYGVVTAKDQSYREIVFDSPDCTGQAYISNSDGWSVVLADSLAGSLALYAPTNHNVLNAAGECLNQVAAQSRILDNATCENVSLSLSCVAPAVRYVPLGYALPLRLVAE